ncbi:hypothetical protein Q5752_005221 [Cryptotrichosporon argae]
MSGTSDLLRFGCARLSPAPPSGPTSAASSFSDPSTLSSLPSSYASSSLAASSDSTMTVRPLALAPPHAPAQPGVAGAAPKSFPHNADLVGRPATDDAMRFNAAAITGHVAHYAPLAIDVDAGHADAMDMDVDGVDDATQTGMAIAIDRPEHAHTHAQPYVPFAAGSPLDSPTHEPVVHVSTLVAVPPLARPAQPVRIPRSSSGDSADSAGSAPALDPSHGFFNELGVVGHGHGHGHAFAYPQPAEAQRHAPTIPHLLNTTSARYSGLSPRTSPLGSPTSASGRSVGPVRSMSRERERRHEAARRPSSLLAHRLVATEPSVPPPRPSPRYTNLPYPLVPSFTRSATRGYDLPAANALAPESTHAAPHALGDIGMADIETWSIDRQAESTRLQAEHDTGDTVSRARTDVHARSALSRRLANLDAARTSTYDSDPYTSTLHASALANERRPPRWDDESYEGRDAAESSASRLARLSPATFAHRFRDPSADDASESDSPGRNIAAPSTRALERHWGEVPSSASVLGDVESASDRLRRRMVHMQRIAERREAAVRDSAERSTQAATLASHADIERAEDSVLRVQIGLERAQRGLERARHNIEQAQRTIRLAEGSLDADARSDAAAPDDRIGFYNLVPRRAGSPGRSAGVHTDAGRSREAEERRRINEFDYQIRNYNGMLEWAVPSRPSAEWPRQRAAALARWDALSADDDEDADVPVSNEFDRSWTDRRFDGSSSRMPTARFAPAPAVEDDDADALAVPAWLTNTPRSLFLSRLIDMRHLADEPPAALARLADGTARASDRADVLRWAARRAGRSSKTALVDRTLVVRAHADLAQDERDECCPVCQDEYDAKDEVSTTACKHTYHKSCLDSWLQTPNRSTCPMCRRDLAVLGYLSKSAPFTGIQDALPHWLAA